MSTSIYPILSYANCLCLGIDKELGSSRLISEERKDSIKVGYKNIVRERLKIYTIAMFTGLGSGLLYWYRNQKQPYIWCF